MLYVFIIIISVIAIIIFWDFFMKVLGVLFFLIISIIALLIFNYFGIGLADIARFIVDAIVLIISSLVNIASNFGNIFVTNIKKLIKFIGVTLSNRGWKTRKLRNNRNHENSKYYKNNNIEEKYMSSVIECKNKIIEIKDIIKDFDYSDKKTYEELTSKVENDLKELENIKNVNKINEIIDEINKIYRNAYNKKNNVSSLSYIMETDENIDLIKKIDIENLE